MFIERHMEQTLRRLEKMFGAVIVTGARQVGKTTFLKKTVGHATYISLDDPIVLKLATSESGTFFKATPPPVFVDEIQYAPMLFPYIKMIVDETKKKGQFYLSGSQQFHMMKNVSESLAGRAGIANLAGLSLREVGRVSFYKPFIPTAGYFSERRKNLVENEYNQVWDIIHKGSMPEMYADSEPDRKLFYAAYVRTYIERDVRELTQVGDEMKFLNFMTIMAGRTGQLLNLSSIARDVGIAQPTADRWLSILCASNLVYLLRPWYNNISKRVIKTPKMYFLDTGLAAYLTSWSSPEVLRDGAMAGAFFETFVITEVLKSYYNAGVLDPPVYFYRDKDQNEIDLMIHQDGELYPIEIKKHADPKKSDISAFRMIDSIPGIKRGTGGVVCMYDNLLPLTGDDMIIPLKYI